MDDYENRYFENSVPLEEAPEEEIIDLAGYQVTKAELFAHSREPSITFWQNRLKFSMACLRRFPGVKHIQIMVNPDERRIKCLRCGEVIESEHRHDYRECSCGACAVDGGKDYFRRVGSRDNWEDCSEVEWIEDEEKTGGG